jgi:hypothetical protein
MMDEHDARLQRIFDERLLRVLPPPRAPRRRSAARFVGACLAVLLTAGGFAFAADVNGTASAAGLSCTDVHAKVEIWWESVRNGTHEEQVQFKQRAAEMVGQSCDANGNKEPYPNNGEKVPPTNKDVVPASDPRAKSPTELSPRCLAAQQQVKEMIASVSTMTRAQELELKQRINEMLAEPCQAAK